MQTFEQVSKEAEALGYKVVLADLDSWDPGGKIITINERRTPRNQTVHLLHEVGHACILAEAELAGDYYDRFPGLQPDADSHVHTMSEFEQEVLAWEKGRLIAYRLGIPIDKNFHRIKAKSLQTYVEHHEESTSNV